MNGDYKIQIWKKSVKINRININFEIDSSVNHTITNKNVADKLISGKPPFVKSYINYKLILSIS